MRWGALAPAFAGLLAACGTEPTAPELTALRVSPAEGVAPGGRLSASVDFVDEDGDLAGGEAEVGLLRRGAARGELFKVFLEGEPAERGTIEVSVRLPESAIPGLYDLSIAVVDLAGRRSGPLVAEVRVNE